MTEVITKPKTSVTCPWCRKVWTIAQLRGECSQNPCAHSVLWVHEEAVTFTSGGGTKAIEYLYEIVNPEVLRSPQF